MAQNGDRSSKDRLWIVHGRPELGGVVDPAEVAMMAQDVACVVRMCGGVSTEAAQRQKDADGVWHTTAMMWRWSSYAPAVAVPRPLEAVAQPQEQEEEPEFAEEPFEDEGELEEAPPVGAERVFGAPAR